MDYREIDGILTSTDLNNVMGGGNRGLLKKLIASGNFPPPFYIGKTPCWFVSDWNDFSTRMIAERDYSPPFSSLTKAEIAATSKLYKGDPPLALDKFRDQLMENYQGPGIYFLIQEMKVIYVGVSLRPMGRIAQHRKGTRGTTKKNFDGAVILPTEIDWQISSRLAGKQANGISGVAGPGP